MCIVIDTNCFTNVFVSSSEKHSEFQPVYDWVTKGKGRVVYGGTKYKKELERARKFVSIFTELSRKNKLVKVSDNKVDEWEEQIKQMLEANGKDHINDERYNDAHLIAIFSVSGCRLLCSEDKKSFPFLNEKQYYLKPKKPPSFYTSNRNANLLCDQYMGPCCA